MFIADIERKGSPLTTSDLLTAQLPVQQKTTPGLKISRFRQIAVSAIFEGSFAKWKSNGKKASWSCKDISVNLSSVLSLATR